MATIFPFFPYILILKIRNSKSVGGSIDSRHRGNQQSTEGQSTLDPGGGGSTIDMERINSQLSLSREKVIASVDPRGGGGGGGQGQ